MKKISFEQFYTISEEFPGLFDARTHRLNVMDYYNLVYSAQGDYMVYKEPMVSMMKLVWQKEKLNALQEALDL